MSEWPSITNVAYIDKIPGSPLEEVANRMARKKNTEEEDTQNEMRLKKTRRKQDVPRHPKQNTDKNSVNKGRKHRGKELDTIQKNSVCDNGETKCFVESLPSKDVSSNVRTVEEGKTFQRLCLNCVNGIRRMVMYSVHECIIHTLALVWGIGKQALLKAEDSVTVYNTHSLDCLDLA